MLMPLAMRTVAAVALAILTACGSSSKKRSTLYVDEPSRAKAASQQPALPDATGVTVRDQNGDDLTWLGPVYFAFDSAELTQPTRDTLVRLHDWLSQHPKAALTIEGHCDEQGTTEYNIALGQKRAQTITDYLARLGTDPSRLTAVSYGAERPAVEGHTEVAWSKNRRGELRVAP
jgi:peptidoglycan-associated lipoprotein